MLPVPVGDEPVIGCKRGFLDHFVSAGGILSASYTTRIPTPRVRVAAVICPGDCCFVSEEKPHRMQERRGSSADFLQELTGCRPIR